MKKLVILFACAVLTASAFMSCSSTKTTATGEVKSAAVESAVSAPNTPDSH